MKTLYCKKCGKKVAEIAEKSLIKKGTICICRDCEELKNKLPDFMEQLFGGKR